MSPPPLFLQLLPIVAPPHCCSSVCHSSCCSHWLTPAARSHSFTQIVSDAFDISEKILNVYGNFIQCANIDSFYFACEGLDHADRISFIWCSAGCLYPARHPGTLTVSLLQRVCTEGQSWPSLHLQGGVSSGWGVTQTHYTLPWEAEPASHAGSFSSTLLVVRPALPGN
ncbi:hypothetical protein AVEN_61594-1 [Araneus ventricosus]|uniref:Uncharacterized protein n=1 Tax=Araneus ventricosus TaxID=182803 RepID=A0A4Y2NJQ5_ARAVE|nr:hypothetical protein AVEN_61594-1 [Araneus ventricosus]